MFLFVYSEVWSKLHVCTITIEYCYVHVVTSRSKQIWNPCIASEINLVVLRCSRRGRVIFHQLTIITVLITRDFEKHFKIKSSEIKTWHFSNNTFNKEKETDFEHLNTPFQWNCLFNFVHSSVLVSFVHHFAFFHHNLFLHSFTLSFLHKMLLNWHNLHFIMVTCHFQNVMFLSPCSLSWNDK